jgi:PHD/YefM family antitoxin component YafN of YafNO toxin-antitoxin module
MQVMKPTLLRKDIYNVLRGIVKNHSELEVTLDNDEAVVVMSKKDYLAQQELLYLQGTGTLDLVLNRMDNEQAGDFSFEDAL